MKQIQIPSHNIFKQYSLLEHIIKNKHIMIPKVWMLRGKPWRFNVIIFFTKNAIEPQLV